MTAQYLNIEARERDGRFSAQFLDFQVSNGEEVDSEIILKNQNTSLYCFDDENKRAIFVELPPNINLIKAPFVYATQFDEAQRLIAVPYDDFRKLAKTLPPVEHIILMYISGRSGSTLISHIFNELDDVMSLSEPDVMTQFIYLRDKEHKRDDELQELLDCTVRMLFKPNPYKQPKTYALKYRMETVRAMDLFQATFPHAKNLYSYRDCEGFVSSFYRLLKDYFPDTLPTKEAIDSLSQTFACDISPKSVYLDPHIEALSFVQFFTLFWLLGMEQYLEQTASGIPILPVHYRDLKVHREQVVTEIFKHCGLPAEKASESLSPFERDAQAGSMLAREKPDEGNKLQLTDEQLQEMNRILERHPVIKQSDFIVPNTLQV